METNNNMEQSNKTKKYTCNNCSFNTGNKTILNKHTKTCVKETPAETNNITIQPPTEPTSVVENKPDDEPPSVVVENKPDEEPPQTERINVIHDYLSIKYKEQQDESGQHIVIDLELLTIFMNLMMSDLRNLSEQEKPVYHDKIARLLYVIFDNCILKNGIFYRKLNGIFIEREPDNPYSYPSDAIRDIVLDNIIAHEIMKHKEYLIQKEKEEQEELKRKEKMEELKQDSERMRQELRIEIDRLDRLHNLK